MTTDERTIGSLKGELFLLHNIPTFGGWVWFSLRDPHKVIVPEDGQAYKNVNQAMTDLESRGGECKMCTSLLRFLAVREAEQQIENYAARGIRFVDRTSGL